MPYNTALPVAVFVVCIYRSDNFFDCKILLITAYLFYIAVKQNKISDKLFYTAETEQRNNIAVLHCGQTVGNKPFLLLIA